MWIACDLRRVRCVRSEGLEGYVMEERRQVRWDRVVGKRPVCVRCGEPVVTEQYLDLEPFGLRGIACGRCRDRCSHWVEWEDDM